MENVSYAILVQSRRKTVKAAYLVKREHIPQGFKKNVNRAKVDRMLSQVRENAKCALLGHMLLQNLRDVIHVN